MYQYVVKEGSVDGEGEGKQKYMWKYFKGTVC